MNYLLSSVFLLICLISFGQTGDPTLSKRIVSDGTVKPSGVRLGIFYSPETAYRMLKRGETGDPVGTAQLISISNNLETPKYSHSLGITAEFHVTRRMFLQTGITYSNFGQRYKPTQLITVGIPWGTGNVYGELKKNDSYHYLNLPLSLRLELGRNKVRFISSIGITGQLFLGVSSVHRIKYIDGGTNISRYSDYPDSYNKFIFAANISTGVQYLISPKLLLRVSPVLRINLQPISDTPVLGYYYNIGLETGVYLKL